MVTKLKDNLQYIVYIRKKIQENFLEWEENSVAYEGQPNNNFGISFKKDLNKIQFIKDRGQLELNLYYQNEFVRLDNDFYNSILEHIPEQDPKWRLSICTELIDFYIDFLKCYYERKE